MSRRKKEAVRPRQQQDELVIEIRSDLLPDPDAMYAADCVDAYVDFEEIVLLFGQLIPGTDRLATMISIRYAAEELRSYLGANRSFVETLRERMNESGSRRDATVDLRALSSTVPDGKYHMERAAFMRMAYTVSSTAEISFYLAKPNRLHQLTIESQHNWNTAIQALLSVYLTTPVLLSLMEKILHLLEVDHDEHQ